MVRTAPSVSDVAIAKFAFSTTRRRTSPSWEQPAVFNFRRRATRLWPSFSTGARPWRFHISARRHATNCKREPIWQKPSQAITLHNPASPVLKFVRAQLHVSETAPNVPSALDCTTPFPIYKLEGYNRKLFSRILLALRRGPVALFDFSVGSS